MIGAGFFGGAGLLSRVNDQTSPAERATAAIPPMIHLAEAMTLG